MQVLKKTLSFTLLLPFLVGANLLLADSSTSQAGITWQPCYSDVNPNLLCGRYPVPLSYQKRPAGKGSWPLINIALIKLPAADKTQKPLGSLFLNPGGPGGSGVDFVRYAGQSLFTPEVRARYDLIGFDPRGINHSEPVTCQLSTEQTLALMTQTPAPSGHEQEERLLSDKQLNTTCAENGNAIMDHMTTANVARDLDVLRQAVGDPLLHYVGYSYGSYLGVTYANLFPQKVGHVVVDGVLDPVKWATGKGWAGWLTPISTRLGSDKGSLATLQEFFRVCDLAGVAQCSFAGNSAARFDAIASRLKSQPQQVILPDGTEIEVTYAQFMAETLNAMYSSFSWRSYADLLSMSEALLPPAEIGQQYQRFHEELGTDLQEPPFDNQQLGFYSVTCSDSVNPSAPEFWPLAAAVAEYEHGMFGPIWTWLTSPCAQWSGSKADRYIGPFDRKTKNPVLVSNTLFDPATPFAGAQSVSQLLPNSRLMTVLGWGHTTPGLSSCADAVTANYLLRGELPTQDIVCKQENLPFALSAQVDVFAGMAEAASLPRPEHDWHTPLKVDNLQLKKYIHKAIMRNAIRR